MRHRDYIFDRSVSKKSRLVPSNYMYRLTETLDSLPDAEDAGNETKVRVIEHSYNKSYAAIIAAAAVCIFAVTGGFLASRPSGSISGGPVDRPADVTVSSSEKHDIVRPVVTSADVPSHITVTDVPSVTSLTVTSGQKPSVTSVNDLKPVDPAVTEAKIPVVSVPDLHVNDQTAVVQPERPEPDPQEPPKEEKPVVSSEPEQPKPEEQKPDDQKHEEQKPDEQKPEQKPEDKPGPEKPNPEKPNPERPNPEKENPNDDDRNHSENPAPPVKAADEAEFFRPDNVFAPEKPAHEIRIAQEHNMIRHDDTEHEENMSDHMHE